MSQGENTLVSLYRTRIDPTATPAAAYGYWFLVVGVLAGLSGVGLFLYGSTFPRGDPTYWSFRQAGIVLAAGGLPLALLGVTFRLTLQPIASAVGSLGVITTTAAIVWFVQLYPSAWTFAGPRPVLLTYLAGIALLAAGLTVVPMGAARLTHDDPGAAAYYELESGSDGWRWRLVGGDHVTLAESGESFPDRATARAALDDLAAAAPVAGTEVTIEAHDARTDGPATSDGREA